MTTHPVRRWSIFILLLGVITLSAACGDDADGVDADGADASNSEDAVSDGEASTDTFPVEIEHAFGSTTIESEPERIVSIGYQEHDALYALGADPVAVRYWFGDTDDVIFPWAEEAAGDADPEILNMPYGELNYEAIAALQPDLIMGIYSGITDEEYETLAAIAPTVAQPDEYPTYGIPWQVSVAVTGEAIGRSEAAAALIDDLEGEFADIAAAHPEWEGMQVAVVAGSRPDQVAVFSSTDPRTRFFTSLGFDSIPEIDDLAGEEFYASLSAENIDVVDGGLIVWDQTSYVDGGRETIDQNPLVANLESSQQGTVIDTSGEVEAAFGFNSVLSIPYALEVLVPRLESALGDGS